MDLDNLNVRPSRPDDWEVIHNIAADAASSREPEEAFEEEGVWDLRLNPGIRLRIITSALSKPNIALGASHDPHFQYKNPEDLFVFFDVVDVGDALTQRVKCGLCAVGEL